MVAAVKVTAGLFVPPSVDPKINVLAWMAPAVVGPFWVIMVPAKSSKAPLGRLNL